MLSRTNAQAPFLLAFLAACLLVVTTKAFSVLPSAVVPASSALSRNCLSFSVNDDNRMKHSLAMKNGDGTDDNDDETERLEHVAAKLGVQAAKLESSDENERQKSAEQVFQGLDTNQDGDLSVEELRQGLTATLKDEEMSEEEIEELLEAFKDNLAELSAQIHLMTTMS